MSCIKLKKLEEILQSVDSFEKPKVKLEQYETPSHIASQILFNIQNNYGDLEGKVVADLGAGPGILSFGASVLGAKHVVAFEIDDDAVEVCQQNICDMEIENIDIVKCDILDLDQTDDSQKQPPQSSFKEIPKSYKKTFDTVLMNPPFGTKKNAGIDMKFLKVAVSLANNVVYSLHKTSTRDYITKKCKELQVNGKVLAELRYNLDATFKFHKKSSVDVEIDFWRFEIVKK